MVLKTKQKYIQTAILEYIRFILEYTVNEEGSVGKKFHVCLCILVPGKRFHSFESTLE